MCDIPYQTEQFPHTRFGLSAKRQLAVVPQPQLTESRWPRRLQSTMQSVLVRDTGCIHVVQLHYGHMYSKVINRANQ